MMEPIPNDFDDLYDQFREKHDFSRTKPSNDLSDVPLWKEIHQNYKTDFCQICKGKFDNDDLISVCPHCNALFHHSHFQEWLKIKGICPVCRAKV